MRRAPSPGVPRVSVVMPAWEAELTIGAAISSVLWQGYRDLELVVIDDGSTDHTADIVAAYGDRVRLIRQSRCGVAVARNTGIAEARGDLITFCDADDVLFSGHVQALIDSFDHNSDAIITANAWWLYPRGIHWTKTRHRGRFPPVVRQRRAILEQNFLSIMSLFRRDLVDEIGPFATSLVHGVEDWEFWMRAVYAGHPVVHQPRPLALYRWGADGLSADKRHSDEAVLTVLSMARRHLDLRAEERRYLDRRLEGADPRQKGRLGDQALRAARYTEAARYYAEAADLCPSERVLVWKARVLSLAPPLIGPLIRARQIHVERAIGFEQRHVR